MEKEKFLSELLPGDKGKIMAIRADGALKRKFLNMGVIPRSQFEVVKLAPLGDPVDVKIKGYHLSLRKDEAALIVVEVENK